jgi:hypothetical protein
MGDLDEAIREHLELKRRRGADPAEVAREEQEALAPVTRSHPIVVPEDLEPAAAMSADVPGDGDAPAARRRGGAQRRRRRANRPSRRAAGGEPRRRDAGVSRRASATGLAEDDDEV